MNHNELIRLVETFIEHGSKMKHSDQILLAEMLVLLGQGLKHSVPNDRLAERCHNGVLEFHCVLRNLQIIKEDEE